MTTDHAPVVLLIDNEAAPIVQVGEQEVAEIAALLQAAPHLTGPDSAEEAAQAINHLSQGYDFDVILDAQKFRDAYLARVASEGEQEWQQGQSRLRDFGKADLDQITTPVSDADGVTFYARDQYSGFPYRVRAGFDGADPSYDPLPTSPF